MTLVLVAAVAGALIGLSLSAPDWRLVAVLGVAFALGGLLGARLATGAETRRLSRGVHRAGARRRGLHGLAGAARRALTHPARPSGISAPTP